MATIKRAKSAARKIADYFFPQWLYKKKYCSQTGEDAILLPFIDKAKKVFM